MASVWRSPVKRGRLDRFGSEVTIIQSLSWGDEYYSANGPRRVFQHAQDAGTIAPDGTCAACGSAAPPSDLLLLPGPGYDGEGDDFVSKTLTSAHRLLEPVRGQ